MARRGIDRLRMARGRAVAAAVVGGTKVRAALDHLAGYLDARLARVVARTFGSAARILGNAARLRRIGLVLLRIPVGGPFPDVADHVVDAVAVGRERRHRRGALVPVLTQVMERKFALPGIGHRSAARRELLAPGELG